MALGALGYPKVSYLREKNTPDPARLLLDTLDEADLDSRVAEGLPWLSATCADMDWDWLLQSAGLRRRQSRLGFVVALAIELAQAKGQGKLRFIDVPVSEKLAPLAEIIPVQFAALQLAGLKGLPIDEFRHIQQVTSHEITF